MLRIAIFLTFCVALATSTIVITNPLQTNFTNNELPYKYGNFGEIPYGKTQSVELFITEKSLCNNDDLDHFTKPTYVVIKATIQQTCSYTKRAILAQSKGAKGIIIATQGYEYTEGNVYLGDDGNGRKVHITSIFINYGSF
jgi:hypothetical protein